MSRRTETWNGYESTLTMQLLEGATSTSVELALGLIAPVYLCIDPDIPDNREWVKVLSITGNSFDTIERGLSGSAGAATIGTSHAVGAKVRAVFLRELQDDIFDDIEDLESAVTVMNSVIAALGTTYLRLDGAASMVGELGLSADPVGALGASPKQYVDTAEAAAVVAAKAYSDSLDHGSYTDAEAVDAIVAADKFVKNTSDTMTGDLTINDDLWVKGLAISAYAPNLYVHTDHKFYRSSFVPLKATATAVKATKLATARTIDITGDIVATAVAFDGSKNIAIVAAVKNDSHTHDTRYLRLSGGTVTGNVASRTIYPSTSQAYYLGSSSRFWKSVYTNRIDWSNNDWIEYDDGNNEWTFYPDGVLRTILGQNVSRFSGAVMFYQAMGTFSSGSYATLRRRDSDGRILELSSNPKYKTNIRPPQQFRERAKALVRDTHGYVYGDVESPDEGETMGMLSTEIAPIFPEAVHWVDGEAISINYDMLVTPILEALRDIDERLAALEVEGV